MPLQPHLVPFPSSHWTYRHLEVRLSRYTSESIRRNWVLYGPLRAFGAAYRGSTPEDIADDVCEVFRVLSSVGGYL